MLIKISLLMHLFYRVVLSIKCLSSYQKYLKTKQVKHIFILKEVSDVVYMMFFKMEWDVPQNFSIFTGHDMGITIFLTLSANG